MLDVCGAPALTARVVRALRPGASGGRAGRRRARAGSLSLAAARLRGRADRRGRAGRGGARPRSRRPALADEVALADARDPVALVEAVTAALGGPADVTVVCVDVPGCEHGAILATAARRHGDLLLDGDVSFAAAALGAEGLAADVTMLIGNGYVPGHADFALDLVRASRLSARCSRPPARATWPRDTSARRRRRNSA